MQINPIDKILITERLRTSMAATRQLNALKTIVKDIDEVVSTLEEKVEKLLSEGDGEVALDLTSAVQAVRHQSGRLEIVEKGLFDLSRMTHVLMEGMSEQIEKAMEKRRVEPDGETKVEPDGETKPTESAEVDKKVDVEGDG